MNVGAILDYVAGNLDAQVLKYMQEYAIPPSLMDKVLDRLQSHMRQMKAEEYAQELMQMQMEQAVAKETQPKSGTEVDTVEGFKEKMGMRGEKDADVLGKEKKQSKNNQSV